MKKAKLFLGALFAFAAASLSAQNVTVTGKITDASTGEGIPFASVLVKGTTSGISSDAEGTYSISVPAAGTLDFSAVGYVAKSVQVAGKTSLDVKLEVDAQFLESTVIVGYGSAKKVSSLVGSVQTVNSQTLKNAPSSSALDQLQGQVAGLSVLTSTGVAGDNAVSMSLHGIGSLTSGSAPLYVIDGIPSSSRAIMAMNPNDIESVSVLKDASATSIYGSRASNGVIYITTKQGSYNENASVTVRSQYGVSTLANTALYENMMSSSELKDFWVRSGLHTESWVAGNFNDERGYNADTKWYKYMMNLVNPQTQNDITIQGGGRRVAYMVSASQFHQNGFTPGNYYDRYTVRSNVQAHPLNWLKAGLNLNLSLDQTQQNPNWGSQANGPAGYLSGGLSFLMVPMYPAVDENGNVYEERFPGSNMITPNFYMEHHKDQYDRYGASGNVFVEIEPVRNLKFVSRAGIDGYIRLRNWQTDPSYVQNYGGTATVGKSSALEYAATITNTIEYSYEINHNNKFSVLVGQEGVANDYTYFYASSQKQTDDRQLLLDNGQQSTYAMSESNTQSRFLSFFGHADYTLFDRYFVDATIRNDASSRFGSAVRNAQFWSAGLRWNLKKEDFLKNVGGINALDLKVSYGTQGNASIGDYSSLGLISAAGTYKEITGTSVTQPANNKLTWENQGLLTVSASGRFFNVLDANIEFYQRKTTSMLLDVPNPYTSGFTETTQNVGSLQNTGVDITLGVDFLRGRDYWARFSTTFNYNAQKITELFDGRDRWEMNNYLIAYVVGKPIEYYMPVYAGVDPADGLPMWYVPGENKDELTMSETTKQFDGSSLTQSTGKYRYAPINGGFSLSGGWKGLSVQADFTYVIGKYMVNNDAYFYANPSKFGTNNTHKSVSDFWTPDHTDAQWPAWSKISSMEFDTHLLEDASFLRLKNLQVAYALPESLLGWTNGVLKGLKITFTGRNLLTCTKYTGIDPEVNSNLTYGKAGNSKQFLGGIELTF